MILSALSPHPIWIIVVLGLCVWAICEIADWHNKKWHEEKLNPKNKKKRKYKNQAKL